MHLKEKVTKCKYDFPKEQNDTEAVAIVKDLLHFNPECRLGANLDFKTLQSHIFFKGIDFEELMEVKFKSPWKPTYEEIATYKYFENDLTNTNNDEYYNMDDD